MFYEDFIFCYNGKVKLFRKDYRCNTGPLLCTKTARNIKQLFMISLSLVEQAPI